MKRALLCLAVGAVIAVVTLLLAKDIIAREAVEIGVTQVTGFGLEIGTLHTDWRNHQITVREIRLMNPPGFEEPLFADLPQLQVDYDLRSLLTGTRHLNELFVNIRELVILKDNLGQSNVGKLKGILDSRRGTTRYRIDKLRLKVTTVTLKDFSRPPLLKRDLPVNQDVIYRNVTNGTDINRLLLLAVMSKVSLPGLGISLDDLRTNLAEGLLSATGQALKEAILSGGALSGSTNLLRQAGKGLFEKLLKP